MLINAIACALLLFSSYAQQTTMQQQSKIMRVKLWLADPHIVLPSQGISVWAVACRTGFVHVGKAQISSAVS